jgi:hypothetical protein
LYLQVGPQEYLKEKRKNSLFLIIGKTTLLYNKMKIIYVDLDGVVADFEKGKKEHPLGNVTP